jgi:hypothetical protein
MSPNVSGPFITVPALPLPEASATVAPDTLPCVRGHSAVGPGGGGAGGGGGADITTLIANVAEPLNLTVAPTARMRAE